ncbi:MAG: PAS domain-containing hybrid sensor histidine kinase/response regulator [Candidatus Nitrospinota bacterium M3_3B_026]
MSQIDKTSYGRALFYFVATLIAFLAAADVMILSSQREMIMSQARRIAEGELRLMGAMAREALLKRDYITVEKFMTQWGAERDDVVAAKAVAPNGFVLAEYHRGAPAESPFHVKHLVIYDGRELVSLEIVKDFAGVEAGLRGLAVRLVVWSIIIVAVMGTLLWLAILTLAVKPLEEEVAGRKKAEAGLREYSGQLDEMVKERTRELEEANERIAASERDLSGILENMQDTYYRTDNGGVITKVSPSVKYLLDYSVKELVGMRLADLYVNPGEREVLLKSLRESGGKVTNFETRLRRKDGRAVWVSANVQHFHDEAGNVIGVEGMARDITEIKRAQEAMRLVVEGAAHQTGEEFLRSLVENLARAIGVKLAFVARMKDETGCDARTLAMWMDGRIAGNIEYELAGTPCEEVYYGKTSFYPDNVAGLFPDDKWLRDIGARSYLGIPFFEPGGNVLGHLGVMDDKPITDRRSVETVVRLFAARAGAELKRASVEEKLNQFKKTLDMTLDCVFMFDPVSFRFFYVNQGAMDQVGYTRKELLSMTPLDIKPEYTKESFQDVIAPLLDGETPSVTVETVHRTKDGRLIPVEVFLQYVVLPGKTGRFVAIVRDISERKRAEEALRHTQKLESLGVLAGGIAHDFNNLLVGILGNANMALEDLPASSPARESVEDIITAARQAADLSKQMLAYSGKGKVVIKPFNIASIIKEMSHLLEISVSKNVSLKYNVERGLPAVEGDPSQIRQVIMNLIINASEAVGDADGEVKVTVASLEANDRRMKKFEKELGPKKGRYVLMEVADNGCGMDEETMEKIFDPFFTTKFTGRGLGLAAVSGIVRGHGGILKVRSREGRGTVFSAVFPAGGRLPAEKKERQRGAVYPANGGTVLVVDDEETIRSVARKMLARAGFDVITASDGAEGVRIFRERPDEIDVALLDMTMPRMDGVTALMEMRRVRRDLRVVLSSGYTERDAASRFAGKGIVSFIQKPYTSDMLLEKIGEALARRMG